MEVNDHFSANAKNDLRLVDRAKEGEQKAYAELMGRYKDSIYFMALKMVNNKDDAQDLTIETFAKAFKSLEKFRPEFAFSTWLFRIATNGCIDFIRKKKLPTRSIDNNTDDFGNDRPYQIKSDSPNPEELSIKNEKIKELKMIVDSLPQRYRILITLRYFDELSYNEIAEQLDLPLGTVKAQMFRARELLSNILNRRKKDSNSDF